MHGLKWSALALGVVVFVQSGYAAVGTEDSARSGDGSELIWRAGSDATALGLATVTADGEFIGSLAAPAGTRLTASDVADIHNPGPAPRQLAISAGSWRGAAGVLEARFSFVDESGVTLATLDLLDAAPAATIALPPAADVRVAWAISLDESASTPPLTLIATTS